jgi:protein-S-isoprenylcysteine O-methyltransferase Ste14
MKKLWAVLGSIVFFVIAPGTVVGLIPWLMTGWRIRTPLPGHAPVRIVGIALLIVGLVPLVESFGRFALQGLGTPAPTAPPEKLVVGGFYRHVRNPMYVGVLAAILGQALLFADARWLWLAAIVWLAFHIFVLACEEPTLRGMFEDDYDRFCTNVPRWLPRLRPWRE